MLIAKNKGDRGFKFRGGHAGRDKEVSKRFLLHPGKYTILVIIDWFDKREHEFSLSCYYP